MNTQRKNSLLLLLCAFIWGTAFVGLYFSVPAER